MSQQTPKDNALRFIVSLGVVSLLADMTYEGARSITGPFLNLLGASAAVVGVVAGAGELIGYMLRLGSGYLADRTRKYWTITLAGYALNLLAVPLLALAGRWEVAAALIVVERIGKGIRTPARDAMLSHASRAVGTGWGFGLHEALDQIGALAGPLVVALVLAARDSYRVGFAVLLGPALAALGVLIAARFTYPQPGIFEKTPAEIRKKTLPRAFWLYLAAAGLIAAGFADFSLIAFHFKDAAVISDQWIPIYYAVAMGADAAAALWFGRMFDRWGVPTLAGAALISAGAAPLAFYGGPWMALGGMVLWGVGMGAQESVMRAAVAEMVAAEKRGSAYGIFNAGYGLSWFLGSALMGILYDVSVIGLVLFSVAAQLASIPILLLVRRK